MDKIVINKKIPDQFFDENDGEISLPFICLCIFTFSNFYSPLYYLGESFVRLPLVLACVTTFSYLAVKLLTRQAVFSVNGSNILLIIVWGFAVYGTFFRTVDIDRSKEILGYLNKEIILFFLISHVVSSMKELKIYILILLLCGVGNAYKLVHFPIWLNGRAMLTGGPSFGGDPNVLTLLFVYTLPFVVALGLLVKKRIVKILLFYCLFILLLGMVEAQSRGGFLALVVMSLFGVYQLKGFKRRMYATVILAVAGGLFFARYAPPEYKARMHEIVNPDTDTTGSAQNRMSAMSTAFNYTLVHPFSEYGLGNHSYMILEEYGLEPSLIEHVFSGSFLVHNIFLQLGADLGLIPLLFYMMFIFSVFYYLRRLQKMVIASFCKESSVMILSKSLAISLCGLLLASFFLAGAYQPFLFYVCGCCISLYEIIRRSVTPMSI